MGKSKGYYVKLAHQAAIAAGIDPDIFENQIAAESGFNPKAGSGAGAQGIAQIMPATAKAWGVNPWNARAALYAAARADAKYLKSYKGDWRKTLAAYNAGVGAVAKYGGVPPYGETQAYIAKILRGQNPKGTVRPNRSRPVEVAPTISTDTGIGDEKRAALAFIFQDQPEIASTLDALSEPSSAFGGSFRGGTTDYAPARAHEGTQVPIRLGKSPFSTLEHKYGLKRSSSNNDAAGVHVTGSNHYKKAPWGVHAYDYGDAINNPKQFRRVAAWARRHPQHIKELFYDPLGWYIKNGKIIKGSIGNHGDHLHLAI